MAAAIKFSVSISVDVNKELMENAKDLDRSRNWIINHAIELYLLDLKKKEK